MPKSQWPQKIANQYARVLRAIVAQFWDTVPVDSLVSEFRTDSLVDRLSALLERAAVRYGEIITPGRAQSIATSLAADVNTYQQDEWRRQLRAVGIDLWLDPDLQAIIEAAIAENVRLIRSLPEKALDDVRGAVLRGAQLGQRAEVVAEEIAKIQGASRSRAILIARDQANKLYGALAKARQEALGITHYYWRSSRDERVRPRHRELNGQKRLWTNGPRPGEEIRCRCSAEPSFDEILDE